MWSAQPPVWEDLSLSLICFLHFLLLFPMASLIPYTTDGSLDISDKDISLQKVGGGGFHVLVSIIPSDWNPFKLFFFSCQALVWLSNACLNSWTPSSCVLTDHKGPLIETLKIFLTGLVQRPSGKLLSPVGTGLALTKDLWNIAAVGANLEEGCCLLRAQNEKQSSFRTQSLRLTVNRKMSGRLALRTGFKTQWNGVR